MTIQPSHDLDALWRRARRKLNLSHREPAPTMEQIDRLLAAGILEDQRWRLLRVPAPVGKTRGSW